MFDEVGIPYYCFLFFDGSRKLEHPVEKLSVVVEIVGFSDIGSAAEEKRTGDDKKVMEAEESIPYILYWLWYLDVEMDHFSNSILHIVVYGQIDSYDEAPFTWTKIAGTNPLCTRLHDEPAFCRVEMQVYFSYPLSTRNFGESHDALHQRFKMAAVVECSRWSTEDNNNLLVQHSTNNLMELSEIWKFTSAHFR
ncbi:hypothetical protein TNCV_4782951 [Trichonephila clavipes]|nr:hypothetical protein TNCV_4782951 [Trichonephila clavipes]